MNILFYCNEYPPVATGGIGSVTKIIAENLVSQGHKVIVIGYYVNSPVGVTKDCINGVDVYRLNGGYRSKMLTYRPCSVAFYLRLFSSTAQKELRYLEGFIQEKIDSEKIDVIELTDYNRINWESYPALNFRKFNVPCVLRIHGSVSFLDKLSGKKRPWAVKNDLNHFSRCDYIAAVSKFSLDYINENFDMPSIDYKNRIVIYNPIEDKFLKNADREKEEKRILFIGKLSETKGCYSLLKAFNKISDKYPDWKLVMIGRGDVAVAQKYLLPDVAERVEFLGYLSREEIQQQIDISAFACVPSYFENFSMVALEIMAREKALIYTERTSGVEIIDDGKNGLLVDPENIDSIADKIEILINDHDYRKKLSVAAYKTILENFTVSIILQKLLSFYASIAK